MVTSKLKNKSIALTEEQLEKIYHFLYETAESHLPHGRTVEKVYEDIQFGKMGEFALKSLCDENNIPCTDVKLENQKYGDGGFDNVVDKLKTDVKTLRKLWQSRVYLGSSSTNDMWTLMFINGDRIQYIGSLLREDIKISDLRYDPEHGNAVYISRELFEKSPY